MCALIWLDLEEEAKDELLKEINALMKRFSRAGKKGVFLLTPTPAHLSGGGFKAFELESIDVIGGGQQLQQLKASDLYKEITFKKVPVNILELLESHPSFPNKVVEILNSILKG